MEQNQEKKGFLESHFEDPEKLIETLVAIFLGLSAIVTSWAAFIQGGHSGNAVICDNLSVKYSTEAESEYNAGNQQFIQDVMTWNKIFDLFLDSQCLKDEMQKNLSAYKIDRLQKQNSEEFNNKIDSALIKFAESEDDEAHFTPFDDEEYVGSYFTNYSRCKEISDAYAKESSELNANADKYAIVGIIFTFILFLLGIIGTLKRIPNRFILTVVSIIGFFVATIYMLTLPSPDDFDQDSVAKKINTEYGIEEEAAE